MIDLHKKYPAKLLLFGEHIVLKGARALAIPFPKFSGNWAYSEDVSKQQNLSAFGDYLKDIFEEDFRFSSFQSELSKGLFFDSDIPTGYGAGSSGALVAAVYDAFFEQKNELTKQELKAYLGKMESFFHGASSGTDPLICHLQENILLGGNEPMQTVELPPLQSNTDFQFFLLDTKIPRKTSPYVNIFLKKTAEKSYSNVIQKEVIPTSNLAIQQFITGDWKGLFASWHLLNLFHQQHFSEMIPAQFQAIWQAALDSPDFKLKICGAGGGGFMLGITKNWKKTKQLFPDFPLIKL